MVSLVQELKVEKKPQVPGTSSQILIHSQESYLMRKMNLFLTFRSRKAKVLNQKSIFLSFLCVWWMELLELVQDGQHLYPAILLLILFLILSENSKDSISWEWFLGIKGLKVKSIKMMTNLPHSLWRETLTE